MSNINDGGPAFPVHGGNKIIDMCGDVYQDDPRNHTLGGGMSLRDWFAGMALQGILSNANTNDGELIVKNAYEVADAMIAARSK